MPRKNKTAKKESGRIYLYKRFSLPVPLFIFVLLAAGVLLAGWTAEVTGMDLLVRAKVAAPPITQPAVIELPVNGTKVDKDLINVSGICPVNSYVKIFRNDIFAGSTLCAGDGAFQMAVHMGIGTNKLVARDYNSTDDPGPTSPSVTVTYQPSATQNPGSQGSSSGAGSSGSGQKTPAPPATNPKPHNYILNTDGNFEYSGYFVGQNVELKLTAGGGVAPYTYDIDWGDHDPRVIIYKDGPFTLKHTYDRAGEFHNSHTIKIYGTDATGSKTFLQLFVIIKPAAAGANSGGTKPIVDTVNASAKWLWVAWPAYGIVLLMSISYVLGEREELFILRHRTARKL